MPIFYLNYSSGYHKLNTKKNPTRNANPLKERGRNPFQVSPIKRSYRKRGKVTRTHTKTKQKNRTFKHSNKSHEILNK